MTKSANFSLQSVGKRTKSANFSLKSVWKLTKSSTFCTMSVRKRTWCSSVRTGNPIVSQFRKLSESTIPG